jgi:hypothetical protein
MRGCSSAPTDGFISPTAGRNCVIGETGTDAGAPKLAWAG